MPPTASTRTRRPPGPFPRCASRIWSCSLGRFVGCRSCLRSRFDDGTPRGMRASCRFLARGGARMSDHSDVERLGVTLAQLEFTTWGWVFREQPILDYGIDAHVEPKRDGVASGRPIAFQIKTGKSY